MVILPAPETAERSHITLPPLRLAVRIVFFLWNAVFDLNQIGPLLSRQFNFWLIAVLWIFSKTLWGPSRCVVANYRWASASLWASRSSGLAPVPRGPRVFSHQLWLWRGTRALQFLLSLDASWLLESTYSGSYFGPNGCHFWRLLIVPIFSNVSHLCSPWFTPLCNLH